jgi:hypothetical protein
VRCHLVGWNRGSDRDDPCINQNSIHMTTPKKRKSKGRRHQVHADSLIKLGDTLATIVADQAGSNLFTVGDFRKMCAAIKREGQRVQRILR